LWWFLYILGDVTQSSPPRTERAHGAPVRNGAPQRNGTPAGRGAPVPRPRVSNATYWRRRVVVLGVGVGLLMILSWAVNSLLATGSTGHNTAAGRTLATRHHTARHAPARHSPVHPSPAASPSTRASHTPAHHKAGRSAQAPGSTSACAASDVTLTVSSPQYWYQPGVTPRFTVRAVSTESRPCHFDMGTRAVSVAIDTPGGRLIWNSADCASGSGSHPVVLTSGSHASLRVSWDRRAGCGSAGNLVRPGEYQVRAAANGDHSKSVNIVLGAKGVSGP
jgi:hypothetical protein